MAQRLFINGKDYTNYIVPSYMAVLDDTLNVAKELHIAVWQRDGLFELITEGMPVRFVSDSGIVWFTGYVKQTPTAGIVAPGFSGYIVFAESEDWKFNRVSVGTLPDFVGQSAGDILKALILAADPNTTLDFSGVVNGPILTKFSIDSTWAFRDAAKALADKIGWRWYILDGVVYFHNQNDAAYGINVNSSNQDFNGSGYLISMSNLDVLKDVSIIGPTEPQQFVTDCHWGDEKATSFLLSTAFAGLESSEVLIEDRFLTDHWDSDSWTVKDPNGSISYDAQKITVAGGAELGKCAIISKHSVEMGGELEFNHGKIRLNQLSLGIVGGIYRDNSFKQESCVAGFWLTANPMTTGIQAIVNGQLGEAIVVSKANHAYELVSYFSVEQMYRATGTHGQFGGYTNQCSGYVTLVVRDYDLSNPLAAPVETPIYDDLVADIPPFALYALLNAQSVYATLTDGLKVKALPSARVRKVSDRVITSPQTVTMDSGVTGDGWSWDYEILPTKCVPTQTSRIAISQISPTGWWSVLVRSAKQDGGGYTGYEFCIWSDNDGNTMGELYSNHHGVADSIYPAFTTQYKIREGMVLELSIDGNTLIGSLDGKQVFTFTDTTNEFTSGTVSYGFGCYNGDTASVKTFSYIEHKDERVTDYAVSENDGQWEVRLKDAPASYEAIFLSYRSPGNAQTRLVNNGVQGKTVTVDASELVRTTLDAELLGQALLTMHKEPLYEGQYETKEMPLSFKAQSGRYIGVTIAGYPQFVSLVYNLKIEFTDYTNELGKVLSVFGMASLIPTYAYSDGASTLDAVDFKTVPTSLDSYASFRVKNVSGNKVVLHASRKAAVAYQARSNYNPFPVEDNWDKLKANVVGDFTDVEFTLPRTNREDCFYIREYDGADRFSRHSTFITMNGFPVIPDAPKAATITVGKKVTFAIELGNTDDVAGIEIREDEDGSVIYTAPYVGPESLTITLDNTNGQRYWNNYRFVTYNSRQEYSDETFASGYLASPQPPYVQFLGNVGMIATVSIDIDDREDIIRQIVEVVNYSTDPAWVPDWTNPVVKDERFSQFGSSSLALPGPGQYYVRCRRADEIGYGEAGDPVVVSVSGVIDSSTPEPCSNLRLGANSTSKGGDGTIAAYQQVLWDASPAENCVGYEVRYALATDLDKYSSVDGGLELTKTINGLLANKAYKVNVRAVNQVGGRGNWIGDNSDWTISALSFTTPMYQAKPTTPTLNAPTLGVGIIGLTWAANTDPDFLTFIVYRKVGAGAFSEYTRTTATSFIDTGVAGGTSYSYYITALNTSKVESTASGTQSATALSSSLDSSAVVPGALTTSAGIAVDGVGQVYGYIDVSWPQNTEQGLTGYKVRFDKNDGNYSYVDVDLSASPKVRIQPLPPNTTFYFSVASKHGSLLSSYGTVKSQATPTNSAATVGAPTSPNCVAGFRIVGVQWGASSSSDVSYYNVRRYQGSVAPADWTVVPVSFTTKSLYAIDKGDTGGQLGINTDYFYGISAVNSSGKESVIVGTTKITTLAVGNTDMVAGTIMGDKIVAGSLTANLLDVTGTATDFRTAINNGTPSATTRIKPGFIAISDDGATPITNWRYGSGTTLDGGKIQANTVQANSLLIGNRGLTYSGLVFSAANGSNTVSWTAGSISYVNDAGTQVSVNITSGSANYDGTNKVYIYWVKDATSLSSTTASATAYTAANVVLAQYTGGSSVYANYGRTMIDGDYILSNTIVGTMIKADQITANHLQTNSVTAAKIVAGAIDTTKLSVTQRSIVCETITFTPAGNTLSWTAGIVRYESTQYTGVVSGSVNYSGSPVYVWFDIDVSTTALQTGTTYPSSAKACLIGVFYGSSSWSPNTGQVIIDGGLIQANTINAAKLQAGIIDTSKLTTGQLNIGGGGSKPTGLNVYDSVGTLIGMVGQLTGAFSSWGAWFKTLGVGGTATNPQMYTDSGGNIILVGGEIRDASGRAILKPGQTNVMGSDTLTQTVSVTATADKSITSGFVDYFIWLSLSVSPAVPDFDHWYIEVERYNDSSVLDGVRQVYSSCLNSPKLHGLDAGRQYRIYVSAVDHFGRKTNTAIVDKTTTNDTGKITSGGALAKQGSIVPMNLPSWTKTSGGVSGNRYARLTIPANFVMYKTDGTQYTINSGTSDGSGGQYWHWSGLGEAVQYFFYPYYDIATNAVHFGDNVTPSPSATPRDGWDIGGVPQRTPLTIASVFAGFNQYMDGRVNLSVGNVNVTTPSSTYGGGGGGGDNTCIEEHEKVEVLDRGICEIGTVHVGEFVKGVNLKTGEPVWRRVTKIIRSYNSHWKVVEGHKFTVLERVWRNGAWKYAYQLPDAIDLIQAGYKILLTVDAESFNEHNLLVGETLVHNSLAAMSLS